MVKIHGISLRVGHALAAKKIPVKRQSSACSDPAFYTSPHPGSVLSTADPLKVSWDTSSKYATCLDNATNIKISLNSPAGGHIRGFPAMPFSAGSYTINLDPSWWNSTANIQMEVSIAADGAAPFFNGVASGLPFNVTYDGKSVAQDTPDTGLKTSGGIAQRGGLPKGSIAAAILLPILLVIAVIVGYIKMSRRKQAEKRKRWSQKVDARMSRISGDWQSMTARGAQAAFRDSSASGIRMSTVFAQEMQMDMRPSGESASFAAFARPSGETQVTRGSHFTTGERTSRISFAADVNASRDRLSTYSNARASTYSNGRASRAFHVGAVPPVPRPPAIRTNSDDGAFAIGSADDMGSGDDGASLSPRQTQGPVPLSNDDINNIDIAPALQLMRATNNPAIKSTDDLLLSPPAPLSPSVAPPHSPLGASAFAPPLSPLGMMPMQPQSATFMSPDDMLRQYAQARASGAKSPPISLPSPVYGLGVSSPISPTLGIPQYTSNGMRNLTGDASLSHSPRSSYGE